MLLLGSANGTTVMPGDPINPTNLDRKAVIMIGNDTSAAVPIVLNSNVFSCRTIRAFSNEYTIQLVVILLSKRTKDLLSEQLK